ncbi:MAG: hypothetical protein DCC49_07405 [Acidobacteria bacterium]|nr:MAG: hypothetical protein DCC49_07405 [Acidobacteriota bacterium]
MEMALKREELGGIAGRSSDADLNPAGAGAGRVALDLLHSSPKRIGVGLVVTLVLLVGAIWLASAPGGARGVPSSRGDLGVSETAGTLPGTSSEASSAVGEAWVHVAGAVANPGVYALAPGSRVNDALAAAGGPSADAEIAAVNLAAEIADGEQIFVPSRSSPDATGAGSSTVG